MQKLTQHEPDYLQNLVACPWRFIFSVVTRRPHDNFFEMEDVFTGESFLLYSSGIGDILQETYLPVV
jgi:hypothetical protein